MPVGTVALVFAAWAVGSASRERSGTRNFEDFVLRIYAGFAVAAPRLKRPLEAVMR